MAVSTPTLQGAKVMDCACPHSYQDKRYGPNRRVHNGTAKGWRCTVCDKEKS